LSTNGGEVGGRLSLVRSYAMGLKVSLDVQEFIELAGLIDASL
jgi:hypothetical protein